MFAVLPSSPFAIILSFQDFRPKTNALILLDMGSHAKGRTHTGGTGKGRKLKT
jgi:hypothetical protein